jgi:ABC-type multidrug transport system ATPase subunit
LSTIRNADRIYVIENGRVVEQGSFTELAAQSGLFSRMIARQMLQSDIVAGPKNSSDFLPHAARIFLDRLSDLCLILLKLVNLIRFRSKEYRLRCQTV